MKKIGNYTARHAGKPPIYDHDKIKNLIHQGLKNWQIAQEIGCHPGYVSELKGRWGLRARRVRL